MRNNRRSRFDDDDASLTFEKFFDEEHEDDTTANDGPEHGDRWSTWDLSSPTERGPLPHPDWLITELAAVDVERGILKTGKEADVFLLSREVPGTDRGCLLAAKRYRSHDHRLFHRDAGYLEGRRVKESRTNRAMASRSAFGKEAIAATWAGAEFGALCRLWETALQLEIEPFTPYPVQILGTEILQEFIGTPDGVAAPRLAAVRADVKELEDLWEQLLLALRVLARSGYAHGDLSAYNILVHEGRLVVIDLPQIVDVVANPQGRRFMERDVLNVATWFTAKGLTGIDAPQITRDLMAETGQQ
ncbi:RIO kinase 1 [Allocatelliglobosispora scoriae]|uniref:non-specific serine/threonine protein kinase n=1 Tax=Allocatelliglobosispora scoriae TaxID=643052 RepID=A0A841C017_9ACTN|nr:RIO1 family regulatory kinase/ATPase [Allocatelliglobosispora scoriae]MBB5873088.1 RIO kinase 1 [Allocatelliglobosispora scoriae]